MNKRNLTANQIHELGIEALSSKLGTAGMIRFLHQHKMGKGNYSVDRHQWLTVPDVETLANQIQRAREEADSETDSDSKEITETNSRETLNLILNFVDDPKTEAPVAPLTEILSGLQKVLNRIGVVRFNSNRVTKHIKDEMGISLLEVGAGSFEVQLAPTKSVDLVDNPESGNVVGNAVEELMKLLDAGSDQDQLKKLLEQLRSRVAKDYTEFLKSLSESVIDTKFTWKSPKSDRSRTTYLSTLQMREAIEILQRFQEEILSTFKIAGTLTGVWLKRKRFQIVTANKTYTGTITDKAFETISQAILNQEYTATIQEISKRSATTDEIIKTEYQLLNLKIINEIQN